jgi:hypothetical protein
MFLKLTFEGRVVKQTLSDADCTTADLLKLITTSFGVPEDEIEILHGYPPTPLQVPESVPVPLSASGIVNNSSLVIKRNPLKPVANALMARGFSAATVAAALAIAPSADMMDLLVDMCEFFFVYASILSCLIT